MAKSKTPNTSMQIKEVIEEKSGDIVINITGQRGRKRYPLVYRIVGSKIGEIDLEMLKLRVKDDIDARENEASKKKVIVDRLTLQIGAKIKID